MKTNTRDAPARRSNSMIWPALVIAGFALLVLHNSAWASAWVTALAVAFVVIVVLAVGRFTRR